MSAGGESCGWPGLYLLLLLHLLTAALPRTGPSALLWGLGLLLLSSSGELSGWLGQGQGAEAWPWGASKPPGEVGGGRIKEETRKLLPSGVASPRPEGELGFALFLHSWSNRGG